MESFNATKYNDNIIELTSANEIEKLWKQIEQENDFILQWNEGGVIQGRMIIGSDLKSKIRNGDIMLSSKNPK